MSVESQRTRWVGPTAWIRPQCQKPQTKHKALSGALPNLRLACGMLSALIVAATHSLAPETLTLTAIGEGRIKWAYWSCDGDMSEHGQVAGRYKFCGARSDADRTSAVTPSMCSTPPLPDNCDCCIHGWRTRASRGTSVGSVDPITLPVPEGSTRCSLAVEVDADGVDDWFIAAVNSSVRGVLPETITGGAQSAWKAERVSTYGEGDWTWFAYDDSHWGEAGACSASHPSHTGSSTYVGTQAVQDLGAVVIWPEAKCSTWNNQDSLFRVTFDVGSSATPSSITCTGSSTYPKPPPTSPPLPPVSPMPPAHMPGECMRSSVSSPAGLSEHQVTSNYLSNIAATLLQTAAAANEGKSISGCSAS